MSNRKIPTRIVKMINTRLAKGWTANEIAEDINGSATAVSLGVSYSPRSVAAVMANLTRGNYTD